MLTDKQKELHKKYPEAFMHKYNPEFKRGDFNKTYLDMAQEMNLESLPIGTKIKGTYFGYDGHWIKNQKKLWDSVEHQSVIDAKFNPECEFELVSLGERTLDQIDLIEQTFRKVLSEFFEPIKK